MLENQKDQLFTEDLVLEDPEKGLVQFEAFREGLLASYDQNVNGKQQ